MKQPNWLELRHEFMDVAADAIDEIRDFRPDSNEEDIWIETEILIPHQENTVYKLYIVAALRTIKPRAR